MIVNCFYNVNIKADQFQIVIMQEKEIHFFFLNYRGFLHQAYSETMY